MTRPRHGRELKTMMSAETGNNASTQKNINRILMMGPNIGASQISQSELSKLIRNRFGAKANVKQSILCNLCKDG